MKRKRFTNHQVEYALRAARTGIRIEEVCSKLGISTPTFYRWRKLYGGRSVAEIEGISRTNDDSARLTRLMAALARDKTMLNDMLR